MDTRCAEAARGWAGGRPGGLAAGESQIEFVLGWEQEEPVSEPRADGLWSEQDELFEWRLLVAACEDGRLGQPEKRKNFRS